MLTSKKLRSHERVAYNKKMGSEDSSVRHVERDELQRTGVEGAPGARSARHTAFCSGCPGSPGTIRLHGAALHFCAAPWGLLLVTVSKSRSRSDGRQRPRRLYAATRKRRVHICSFAAFYVPSSPLKLCLFARLFLHSSCPTLLRALRFFVLD